MKASIKRTLAVAGVSATIGIAGISGLGVASAATDQSASGGASSLITKLAEKFNLKKEDVQAVFDEDRAAREAERQQKLEERLGQAVTGGKITEAQKAKIIAKLAELKAQHQANRDAMEDKTAAERRTSMQQEREGLRQWAKDNGIALKYLRVSMGHHGPKEPGKDEVPAEITN